MWKKIAVLVVLLFIVGSFAVYKMYNKPHVNIVEAKPDVSLASEFLKNEFINDEDKANAKYLDQIIQIKGPIVKIVEERGKTIITLGEGDLFGNVSCHMLAESSNDTQNLKEGQIVVLKGVCTGFLMDVILVRCVLVN